MMNKNPYDTSIDWLQLQYPVKGQEPIYPSRQQGAPQPPTKMPAKQARMPKQKALELVSALKKGIVVSSVISFGALGWLATGHVVGITANTTKTVPPVTSSSSNSSSSQSSSSNSSNNSSSSTSQSNGGGFFNQGGGFGFGSSSSQSSSSSTGVS